MSDDSEISIRPEHHSLFKGDVSGPSLTATYYVYSSELNLESAANHIAATISTGLGVQFHYVQEGLKYLNECCPKVEKSGIKANEGNVILRLPLDWMVRKRGYIDIAQVLSFIYGDFFQERQITRVKLIDLDFSPEAIDYFKGPLWGTDKIRDVLNTSRSRRPHIGVVPHPPLGMSAEKYAQLCFRLAVAGADHIVDSDVLTDPPHCSIEDRTTLVAEAIEKSKKETNKPAMYSVNITSNTDRLLENADRAIEASKGKGLIALGICVANIGFSALNILREYVEQKNVPIHVHTTGLHLITRNPTFGVNYKAWNALVRLLGADIAHAGSLTGRYLLVLETISSERFSSAEPMIYSSPVPSEVFVQKMRSIAREESIREATSNNEVLTIKSFKNSSGEKIKKTFPLIAGGINPANAEYNVRLLGNDVILLAGTGLFKSPTDDSEFKAVQSIVRALCQTLDIIMNGENVCNVVTDRRRRSKFKDLVNFFEQYEEEFKTWDWRKQPTAIRENDKLKPYIS
jgi:ribulose 1,5-bisphosphate carboxylase large subunit-like protein